MKSGIVPGPPRNLALGYNLFAYGDSLSVVPAIAGVYGKDWLTLLQKQAGIDRLFSYAVGGSDSIETAWDILNGVAPAGYPVPANSKWDGTRRGIVTLSLGLNDATATSDRSGATIIPSAIDAKTINGLTGALRAILAIMSSASRSEVEAATLTGTWSTAASTIYSGGSARYTSTPGDHVQFNGIAFPASGRVHLIAFAYDPVSGSTPAAFNIAVDGVQVKAVPAQTMRQQKLPGAVFQTTAPVAIEIDAAPGTHSVTVTHAGSGGQILALDCLIIPAASPPPILHVQENFTPVANGGGFSQAQIDTLVANRTQLYPAYTSVFSEFPNASEVPLWLPSNALSTADGIHPNERGHVLMAQTVGEGLRSLLAAVSPDNMNSALGAIANPQISQLNAGPGVWPLGSGVVTAIAGKSMLCIYGGTVTAIAIDGTNTGLTSGSFIVRAGHRIAVTYTVAPSYTNWDVT